MNKKLTLLAILVFVQLILLAQNSEVNRGERPQFEVNRLPENVFLKGKIIIKFKPQMETILANMQHLGADGILRFNIPAFDAISEKYKVNHAFQTFSAALANSPYSERHKAWGFHLWYVLDMDVDLDVRKALMEYKQLTDIVEICEPQFKIKSDKMDPVHFEKPVGTDWVPVDTRFAEQWHYHNTRGGDSNDVDIDLPEAWDIEKGSSNVTVAVIDGGVDTNHADLRSQLWVGTGTEKFGYNFADNSPLLTPDDHGSHTSGTVGAKSNNGVGVSGIAGGDGTTGSGVRIMSCQIFGASSRPIGPSFVWAADRGAAISTNSWGYTGGGFTNTAELDAIDYFIANGGGSVLTNGLVIFSAGNDGTNAAANRYPNAYHRVIDVAATNIRDIKAWYSNFGDVVDISAPGGETSAPGILSTGVLSCVKTTSGGYNFFQGTSMATPHVSGVAALIVSRAQGRLSADDVKSILLTNVDDMYARNPTYLGKLGTGRLNAFKCLQATNNFLTQPVINAATNFTATRNGCNQINLSWTKNAANNDVVVALALNNYDLFGMPAGNYNVNDAITGGGVVIYKGPASSFAYNATLLDTTRYYFKIWSVNASNQYSMGRVAYIITPSNTLIPSFGATAISASQINLTWTKNICFMGDVLVANNTVNTFGNPSGTYVAGNAITGGGTVIYKGPLSSFNNTGLADNTTYFYSIWAESTTGVFGSVKTARTRTLCLSSSFGLPLTEPVSGTEINPCLWDTVFIAQGTGTTRPQLSQVTSSTNPTATPFGNTSGMFLFNSYNSNVNASLRLVSKPINTAGANSVDASFWWYADSSNYTSSAYAKEGMTAQWSADGNTWNNVEFYPRVPTAGRANRWTYKQISLPSAALANPSVRIGFLFVSQYGNNCYLDSLKVTASSFTASDGTEKIVAAEFTDSTIGWTHYYDSAGARLLSVQKNGNNIGRVGNNGFGLKMNGTAGYSTINITGSNYVSNPGGWKTMNRYYDLTPVTEPTTDVKVRFYYLNADSAALAAAALTLTPALPSISSANMYVYKINPVTGTYDINPANGHVNVPSATAYNLNGFWQYSKSTSGTSNNWAYSNLGNGVHQAEYVVRHFGGGGIGIGSSSGTGALPVRWLRFVANAKAETVQLEWEVAAETNVLRYELERSADGNQFITLGKVNATAIAAATKTYNYTDATPLLGSNFYRIKQIDKNGDVNYSKIVLIKFAHSLDLNVWPNPAHGLVNIRSQVAIKQVSLIDITGKQLQILVQQTAGVYKLPIVAAGTYFLQIETVDQKTIQKLVVQ